MPKRIQLRTLTTEEEAEIKRLSKSRKEPMRLVQRARVIAAMLDDAGLEVDQWLGDWRGGARKPTSPEIIPIGRLR